MRKVTVESTPSPYTLKISTDAHQWSGDEPADLGGADKGPSPYELLLSSVGACTAITVQMYARRKEWPLESISVELDHRKMKAEECPDCTSTAGFVSEISLKISLKGDLSEEQRERILSIAEKCPVKKTLEGEIKFRPTLV
ncbi:MAG: OsmC family protein [Acidobacteriota bacterium]|nr:MAG: OsmC family protein [Acidobacteriota bacterium]